MCTGLSDQEPRPHDNDTALCGDSRGSNRDMLSGSRIRYVGSHIYRIYKIVAPGYGTAVFFYTGNIMFDILRISIKVSYENLCASVHI